ncbi:hypothetical protein MTP99_011029 [Tenebrio molitor]|uniref:Uncharacterized protein n=1 Tax=Tenebrio molitor TaxID=7067 RepID=A0A8J6HFZ2_TENMO|nr:hypothetical protein GEV33_009074 [Tenebrio molitor]KAJ3634122.1 hypothetical protein MTP99_011029 [Tenebrio molitor]
MPTTSKRISTSDFNFATRSQISQSFDMRQQLVQMTARMHLRRKLHASFFHKPGPDRHPYGPGDCNRRKWDLANIVVPLRRKVTGSRGGRHQLMGRVYLARVRVPGWRLSA